MSLCCPKCRRPVAAVDVNVQADVARCPACGEVFRASAALGTPPAAAPTSDEVPPIDHLPEGSRVQIEQQGGAVTVHFPPAGFSWTLVFLMGLAVGWWSFLGLFVGAAVVGVLHESQESSQVPATHDGDSDRGVESRHSSTNAEQSGGGDTPDKAFSCFIMVFLTPFFMAGLGMLFAICWPFFGHVMVRIEGRDCFYRASLFGIGRTRRASLDDTALRWLESPMPAGGGRQSNAAGRRMGSPWGGNSYMLLALGSWETPLGGTISLREQQYVFRVLRSGLGQAESPLPGVSSRVDLSAPPPPKIVSLERGPDGSVRVVLPPRGFNREAAILFVFAAFWNAITGAISSMFIGGMGEGCFSWLAGFILVLFWMVGIWLPFWACWQAWGTTELCLDRSGATLTRRLFGRQLVRRYAAQDLQPFTQELSYSRNDVLMAVCRLTAGRRKATFGHTLSAPDQKWLVSALNQALKDLGLG